MTQASTVAVTILSNSSSRWLSGAYDCGLAHHPLVLPPAPFPGYPYVWTRKSSHVLGFILLFCQCQ